MDTTTNKKCAKCKGVITNKRLRKYCRSCLDTQKEENTNIKRNGKTAQFVYVVSYIKTPTILYQLTNLNIALDVERAKQNIKMI